MRLSRRLDCPELGIHKVAVCDWSESQTDPDWDSWTFGKLNSLSIDPMPTLFWLLCLFSITCLPKHWICLEYDESWGQYDVLGTIEGFSIPVRIDWENLFPLACWYMRPLLCCQWISWHKNGEYTSRSLSVRNEWPLFPTCWYGVGIGLPTSDHERIDSSVLDELPNWSDWHLCNGKFQGLEGKWAFPERSDWSSSAILNGIWSSWWSGLWSRGRMWGFQTDNRHICRSSKCNLSRRFKSAAALSFPKWERKVPAETWVWERIVLMVRIRAFTRSAGTLTIFCCVRNSIPINVNCCAGIKSDFFRFGMKLRFCTEE